MTNTQRPLAITLHIESEEDNDVIEQQQPSDVSIIEEEVRNPSGVVVNKNQFKENVYRKAQERGMVRVEQFLGYWLLLYIACREMQTSRTLNDIADTTSVKRKEIAKNYRRLVFELDIKSPAIDPTKCIAKIANNANITERTKREAMEIMADVIRKESSAGKEPMGLAATVLYVSCKKTGEDKTQVELARA